MKAIGKGLLVLGLSALVGHAFGQADVSLPGDSVVFHQNAPLAALTEAEMDERLDHLVQQVQRNEKAALTWWYSWIGIYAGATVGQGLVACLSSEKSTRQDMVLGAGTTLLGMVGQFITPVKSGYNAGMFDQRSNRNCAELLSQTEALLVIQADIAQSGKSWQTQALFGTVNLASGLITWLGFKRSVWDGVANFALNTAITELQIYTQPVRAIKDYKDCVSGKHPTYSLQAFVLPGEVGLVMRF